MSLSGGKNIVYRNQYSDWQESINFDLSSRILEGTKLYQNFNGVFLMTEVLVAVSFRTINVLSDFEPSKDCYQNKQAVLSKNFPTSSTYCS